MAWKKWSKDAYPETYAANVARRKARAEAARAAQEEARERRLAKAGTYKVPKPANIENIIAEANRKAPAINSKQITLKR